MDADLLDFWRTAAKDPDTEPPQWLKHGAPSGITEPIRDCGIFPNYDPSVDRAEISADDIFTQPDFANYSGVEGDPDVIKEVERLLKCGYVKSFDSIEQAREYLKATPILSKIGVIKKLRGGKLKC